MHVVLWDTRTSDVSKDFAGGFGVGLYPGHKGWRGRIIRHYFARDRRPVSLVFAYLAGVFRNLGHAVEYVVDRMPERADLMVFCPALISLSAERKAIAEARSRFPKAEILVAGLAASMIPEAVSDLGATIVRGEAEQLYFKLDEVLGQPGVVVDLGIVEDLDRLPFPDWSPFDPQAFRVGYDFWQFPTALAQASRGCSFKCGYCPYTVLDNSIRIRDPLAVADEILHANRRWGFRSFKFRDPLFGFSQKGAHQLAEAIARLPQRIQFSVETRIELAPADTLRALKRAGLTSITIGIETPDEIRLRSYGRGSPGEDRQKEFIELCQRLGIRTVAGFMIGFPDDTEESIRRVAEYAQRLNPTFANFNLVTPYPGTAYFAENRHRIVETDLGRYSSYSPVFKYDGLTPAKLTGLSALCFNHFYFRWEYLCKNAHLLYPALRRFQGLWRWALGDNQLIRTIGGAARSRLSSAGFGRRCPINRLAASEPSRLS
jgi:anaerobic magnesium-protoporphyrin IX monomethyl ester cyclase